MAKINLSSLKVILVTGFIGLGVVANAQQKIGTNPGSLNPAAALEIESTNRGFLPPRVALSATNVWGLNGTAAGAATFGGATAAADGLMVYNTATAGTAPNNVEPGFYVWQGGSSGSWRRVAISTSSTGNAITSVTGTAPITVTNGTSAPIIGINQAALDLNSIGGTLPVSKITPAGTAGQVLTSTGGTTAPTWQTLTIPTYAGSTSILLNAGSFERAALTGDVTAAANSNATTVARIQGRTVSAAAPTNGQVLKWDGTTWAPAADDNTNNIYTAGTGLTLTGSEFAHAPHTGDVTGTTALTIANAAVNTAKLADNAVTSAKIADGTIATADVANSAITYAKLQNVAAARLLGNPTATAGVASEISVGAGLSLSTAGVLSADAATIAGANVTAGSNRVTLGGTPTGAALRAFSVDVNEANLNLANIGGTLPVSKITPAGTAGQVLTSTGGTTAPTWQTLTIPTYAGSTSILLNAGSFERAALTGDVTAAANSNATTVARIQGRTVSAAAPTNGQVLKWDGTTWAPAADDNTNNIYTAGTGLTLTGNVFSLTPHTGDVTGTTALTIANAAVNTAKLADNAVTSVKIADGTIATADVANSAITYAKLQNVAAARILGNPTATAGVASEISVGAGLSLSTAGVLSADATTIAGANVTAGSNRVTLGGTPTGAALRAFSVDVNEANLDLANIGGTLPLSKLTTGTAGQTLTMVGTTPTWVTPSATNSQNIYTTDGTLSGARTLSQGNFGLTFSGVGSVSKFSGSLTAPSIFVLGRTAMEAEFGVAGSSGLGFNSTSAGDTWLKSNLNNLFLGTTGASSVRFLTNNVESMRITSTGLVGIGTTTPTSTLQVNGSVSKAIRRITAARTLDVTDYTVIANAFAAGFDITLPAPNTCVGREYVIRKVDESSNAITFTFPGITGSNAIRVSDTSATVGAYINSLNYTRTIRIQSDGTDWYLLD